MMKRTFTVEIRRTTVTGLSIDIEAADAEEARELAFKKLKDGYGEFDDDLLEDEKEVTDVYLAK